MIFNSSHRKIGRANQHIDDFKREFKQFIDEKPYEYFFDRDSKIPEHQIHKARISKPLPSILEEIAADAVNNLRSALGSGWLRGHCRFRQSQPGVHGLPFLGSAANFDRQAPGRCKDIPDKIFAFFRTLKPYKGGDDLLCALNDLCIADKHKLLTPFIGNIAVPRVSAHAHGFFSMPEFPTWDSEKNEIELFTVGPQTEEFEYDVNFAVLVAFAYIEPIRGQEALRVLQTLSSKVEGILVAMEAEARRIGIAV